ncbi:polysaccharide/O-antigen exporter permease [Asaia krungthepensis NRIC 0535]|uniref:Polysaccharide/O-antigen exporter permease n=1 Tax=Asaia krungthepensis NRIC 0535 TaxID=1307925 RepID=A0ABQ0Q111_9PROT|nr:polysaccharide/O-antigen exporter permease [Asaia krungthepensis NRIC 0535]
MPLAMTLGWLDIKMRYRGSMLGPFWLTITTAVMVAALGVLYAELFNMVLRDYLPFLALSLVLWGYISTLISESTVVFSQESRMIQAARMPFTVFACQAITRNLLVLLHNAVVVLAVFLIFGVTPYHVWLILPALGLWIVDSFAVMFCLGLLGARFRDIPPIVTSLLQVFFFITPIIWRPELVGTLQHWILLDPFYPLLAIMRTPLLGEPLPGALWGMALAHSAVLIALAVLVFTRFRARIAYWV